MGPPIKSKNTFEERLRKKVIEQVKGRKAGFLLGAGASFLKGTGFPLAPGIWLSIKDKLEPNDRRLIESVIPSSVSTLEQALDELDKGKSSDANLRHRVTAAIAKEFMSIRPPLGTHAHFLKKLSQRLEYRIPIFTLNYDTLIEMASDDENLHLIDGFLGIHYSNFEPEIFNNVQGIRNSRGRLSKYHGVINLYKLHGSLGWYTDSRQKIKRISSVITAPDGWRHLMIPPSDKKTSDTGFTPYSMLWSEYRAHLTNDRTRLLHRLVCAGYGFGDSHVNNILEPALGRSNFTLVILAKELSEDIFNYWSGKDHTIIITQTKSSLYKEMGTGLDDIWSFEWLAENI